MQLQSTTPATRSDDRLERTEAAPVQRTDTRARTVRLAPAVDIFENDDELMLCVDLPGVAGDAIDLRVESGTLTLMAERPGRVYHRAFALSDRVDPSGVDADLKNGVLTVRLRKREDMKPRRIEIRTGE